VAHVVGQRVRRTAIRRRVSRYRAGGSSACFSCRPSRASR
jgi:hypothetical protein